MYIFGSQSLEEMVPWLDGHPQLSPAWTLTGVSSPEATLTAVLSIKLVAEFVKKINIELPLYVYMYTLKFSPKYTLKKTLKTVIQTRTLIWIFIEALFKITRRCKQPKFPSTDEWINKISDTYVVEYYSPMKSIATWSNNTCYMNKPWKHYTKWQKSDTEWHLLHNFIYMK